MEKGASTGADCRIDSGAVLRRNVRIGNRVIIQSGAVVGSEGFGNAMAPEGWVRIPCFGTVVIEDDAEIGANVTIDRGNFAPTVIGRGARIDNLVQIAHNVEIGAHTAMAAQVGISGSTRVGSRVMIGGQAGFVGHITIGDGAFVGAQAGVRSSVNPGAKVSGYPARDLTAMHRIDVALERLPDALKELRRLRKTSGTEESHT
jgi:UDP-3-O-[3-hydroxymyristoyl] glucosamine N-acyltransferase